MSGAPDPSLLAAMLRDREREADAMLEELRRLRAIEAAARAYWRVINLSADLRPEGAETAAREALYVVLGGDPEAEEELRAAGVAP